MGLNETAKKVVELKWRATTIIKAAEAEGSLLFREIGQLFHDLLSLGQGETAKTEDNAPVPSEPNDGPPANL